MIKDKSYILVFSLSVFFIILLVTAAPVMIKTILIIAAIGFLFPMIKNTLGKNLIRKMKVACYSALAYTIGLFLISFLIPSLQDLSFHFNGEFFLFIMMVLLYSLIGNLVYGLPVSLLAETVSMRCFTCRFWLSGFIHIGFGVAAYIVAPGFFIPVIICSLLFFALDEITRKESMLIDI